MASSSSSSSSSFSSRVPNYLIDEASPGGPAKRKRKLRAACLYCRRSHLVCEEARPCSRCVKRGIGDRCTDSPDESSISTSTSTSIPSAPAPAAAPVRNGLQDQPIFQPPSSAELDSLFSSYFFDVTQAAQPLYPPVINHVVAHDKPASILNLVNDPQQPEPNSSSSSSSHAKREVAAAGAGSIYAPYPYRKGYASLMRFMTEQNWSEQSIRTVEAALAKVRQLWFALEDNIQPSSLIQLQAEWAGNVRYYSETVLPATPVPMVVCRKAGEVYASNQLAQTLFGRSRSELSEGRLSCYQLMTEASAAGFFRLYEIAVDGEGTTATPLFWDAEILTVSRTIIPTRGVFEMKIAPCGLPSLLVVCFIPQQLGSMTRSVAV